MPQDPKGDKNRLQFKQLIAANPNYFVEQVKGGCKEEGSLRLSGPTDRQYYLRAINLCGLSARPQFVRSHGPN